VVAATRSYATKVYHPIGTGPNGKHLSAKNIRRACEASLERLKADHIDLYHKRHIDRATASEAALAEISK